MDVDEWKQGVIYTPSTKSSQPKKDIDPNTLSHMDTIAILLEIGNLLEFHTYTGHPRNKCEIFDLVLGKIASLKEIPSFMEKRALEVAKHVDVIWFDKEVKIPAYCFEVEYRTRIREALLRMYQIALRFENTKFLVIGHKDSYRLFKRKIVEDPFTKFSKRCRFQFVKDLVAFHEVVLRFAEGRFHFFGTSPGYGLEEWSI